VAFSASLGLLVYRHVTADSETAASTDVSEEEPPEGREVPTRTLKVGDCLNTLPGTDPPQQPGGVAEVAETVLLVQCEGPHEQEVYHLFELAAGPYPGDEQVEALAHEQCSAKFKEYVGIGPEWSELDFFYVWPWREAWELGNRRGGCSLFDAVGRDLTGSMAGSSR
jgi:Septum formation